jgi:3-oxocholest-4-en-26-oyl-CoA dehydrogenase beta subunit
VLVFLVEPSDDGVTVQPQALTDGADAGRLVLDGVALGHDRVLGAAPGGAEVTDWLVARGTVGACAVQAGVLERGARADRRVRAQP